MKVVLQRSGPATVKVNGEVTGSIEKGYVLLVGITHEDTIEDAKYIANKIANLRLWEDDEGKINHSILEVGGDNTFGFSIYIICKHIKRKMPKFHRSCTP